MFRGGVDFAVLDVVALDERRRPVEGLSVNDFTVVEDGVTRSIDAFSVVASPHSPTRPSLAGVGREAAT